MRVIYHIEDRGSKWIFHWFIYMISGLRFILNKTLSSGKDGGGAVEQNTSHFTTDDIKPPYYLYFSYLDVFLDYHHDTFDLLSDTFKVIKKEDILVDDIIVNNYGETILNKEYHIDKEGYIFLRDLMSRVEITDTDREKYQNKKFYLARSKAYNLAGNSGIKRRQVLNEEEFINALQPYGVQGIFLEDFSLTEKIKLFRLAKTIIAPNTGGLVFSLVCEPTTTIVELNVDTPHQINHQYRDQCRCFKIPYHLHTTIKMDNNDNMKIDIPQFIRIMKIKNIL